jgi:protein-disulfide isomerase
MRRLSLLLPLVPLVLAGATCRRDGGAPAPADSRAEASPPPAAPPAPQPAPGPAKAAPADPLEGLAWLDVRVLSPSARKELTTVLTDEFCYCGCPHSVGACLQTHDCPHARRMTLLAAADAAQGIPAVETLVTLGNHYRGFSQKRATFKVDERQCMGPADAAVTVVEFADFECPFCNAARPMLKQLVAEAKGKVRLCYSPFPLSAHPNGVPAANAALFARDAGKFQQMHDALFDHQAELSPARIAELGKELGLDGKGLSRAMAEGKYKAEIDASREAGLGAGVDATPTLYMNGRKHVLPFDLATLVHSVEDELEWTAHRGWGPDGH